MVDTIWCETREHVRAALDDRDFEAWIEPVRAIRFEHGVLTLEAPSQFSCDWLKQHYLAVLETAVSRASRTAAVVQLVVNRTLAGPAPAPTGTPRPPRRATGPAPSTGPPERYTFASFVVGDSNRMAYDAARAVVVQPGARFNPLFVHGGPGLGKTHLLSATAHGLLARERGGVVYLSAENFVNEMIAALRRDQMERFRQRFRGIRTLVVDDVQFLAGKVRSQEEFVHTFNTLYDGRRQIVLASDRPPDQMPGIEETLRSRFASGLLVDVKPPDPTLRLAIVERKAAGLGLELPPEVQRFLADHWCANVRELEGALTRIDALAHLSGQVATLPVVRQTLPPRKGPAAVRTVEEIVDEVCRHFRVTPAEIASPRRHARVAVPRQLAMYLCRRHTDQPLVAIGQELGGRDHTTVLHALSAIERRLREDVALREAVQELEKRIQG